MESASPGMSRLGPQSFQVMPKRVNRSVPDEWLLLGLRQAAHIHSRQEVRQRVVKRAACNLTTASSLQKKRLRPDPHHPTRPRHPTRIYLKDLHIFQRLVLTKSEEEEIRQEDYAPDSVSDRDLTVRYLACIARIILYTNSLYAVTGVCRFIHYYELKDVRCIYEAMLNDTDPDKSDEVLRQHRKSVRDKVGKRFYKYLRETDARNGQEKHFQLRENQADPSLLRLVRESLDLFKPWLTNCPPLHSAAYDEMHGAFQHHDVSVCELRRFHVFLHPDCFRVLSVNLGIEDPAARLGIPEFFPVKSIDKLPPGGPGNPPAASAGDGAHESPESVRRRELESLKEALDEQYEKLDRFVPRGVLTVKVDGEDVASIDLSVADSARFTIGDEDAEVVEVVSQSDELILATHLVDETAWVSEYGRNSYGVCHPSGANITFTITQRANAATGGDELLVEVTYRERRFGRALGFLWRRVTTRIINWAKAGEGTQGLTLQTLVMSLGIVHMLVAVVICASAVWLYRSRLSLSDRPSTPASVFAGGRSGSGGATPDAAEDKRDALMRINKVIARRELLTHSSPVLID